MTHLKWMDDENRVLRAIDPEDWMTQSHIRSMARMDATRCADALKRMATRGWVEAGALLRGMGGRPIHIYRRAQ